MTNPQQKAKTKKNAPNVRKTTVSLRNFPGLITRLTRRSERFVFWTRFCSSEARGWIITEHMYRLDVWEDLGVNTWTYGTVGIRYELEGGREEGNAHSWLLPGHACVMAQRHHTHFPGRVQVFWEAVYPRRHCESIPKLIEECWPMLAPWQGCWEDSTPLNTKASSIIFTTAPDYFLCIHLRLLATSAHPMAHTVQNIQLRSVAPQSAQLRCLLSPQAHFARAAQGQTRYLSIRHCLTPPLHRHLNSPSPKLRSSRTLHSSKAPCTIPRLRHCRKAEARDCCNLRRECLLPCKGEK